MELGYVVKAVRRYWPVVVIVGVLGLVAGSVLALDREPQYESTGSVLVAPTTNGGFSGLPGDRFVMSQLVVFESPRLTSRALELAEVDLTPFEAREAVTFEQVTGTDVVMVTTSAAAPETAQALTNGYIDAYFEELQNRVESNDLGPELEALDRSIDEIVDQIRLVDQQIADVLAPFLLPVVDDGDGVQAPRPIPALAQIAPALATERQILGERYSEYLRRRTELQFSARPQIESQIVQRAELPAEPVDSSPRLLALVMPIGGLLAGTLAATVLARASRRVLDEPEVASELGAPIAVSIPRCRSVSNEMLTDLELLPAPMRHAVNQLCVQAETQSIAGSALTVVIAGTQRRAGATTLAAAMAHRFAQTGSKVLLVDADHAHPEISARHGVKGDGLTALTDQVRRTDRPDDRRSVGDAFTRTSVTNLVVVGQNAESATTVRPNVFEIMEAAVSYADVVVFDPGPMLESASSIKLAQQADVTVLAVPVRQQARRPLSVIARQLETSHGLLLPVAMPRLNRRGERSRVDRHRDSESRSSEGLDQTSANMSSDSATRSATFAGVRERALQSSARVRAHLEQQAIQRAQQRQPDPEGSHLGD